MEEKRRKTKKPHRQMIINKLLGLALMGFGITFLIYTFKTDYDTLASYKKVRDAGAALLMIALGALLLAHKGELL